MAATTTSGADDGPARTRWLDVLANATALYPLLVLAALYGIWCAAWLHLGHPPRPFQDDPKSSASTAWLSVTSLLLAGLLPGSFLMVGVQTARVLRNHRRPWPALGRAAMACAVWFGAVWLLATDPGDVLLWFFD